VLWRISDRFQSKSGASSAPTNRNASIIRLPNDAGVSIFMRVDVGYCLSSTLTLKKRYRSALPFTSRQTESVGSTRNFDFSHKEQEKQARLEEVLDF